MTKPVALKPRLSEKAYALSEVENTYIFEVSIEANCHSIARAVESQYEVAVNTVRIANVSGKNQRSIKKGGRSVRRFKRANIRKAYVTLKEGDKLPIFAAVEEASAPAKENK